MPHLFEISRFVVSFGFYNLRFFFFCSCATCFEKFYRVTDRAVNLGSLVVFLRFGEGKLVIGPDNYSHNFTLRDHWPVRGVYCCVESVFPFSVSRFVV